MAAELDNIVEQDEIYKALIQQRLYTLGVKPSENLGQNFLIDAGAIAALAGSVTQGNDVIEIGPGMGQLTEALAARAHQVHAIELDTRFEPVLTQVASTHPNVHIYYGDALTVDYRGLLPQDTSERGAQVVANLPYHISEPFLYKVKELPVDDITLTIGKRLGDEIFAPDEESLGFGKLTLLAQAYFDTELVRQISGDGFFPSSKTDAAIIRFTPADTKSLDLRRYILRRLFSTQKKGSSTKAVIKTALAEYDPKVGVTSKRDRHRHERRSLRMQLGSEVRVHNFRSRNPDSVSFVDRPGQAQQSDLDRLSLPGEILLKPFARLDTSDLRTLSAGLRRLGSTSPRRTVDLLTFQGPSQIRQPR